MLSEIKIQALLKLINEGIITINDIKNADYKAEIQNRLTQQGN